MSVTRASSRAPRAPSRRVSHAAPATGGKPESIVARSAAKASSSGAAKARQRSPSPELSASRLKAVRSTSRYSAAPPPSGRGCAQQTSGWIQRSPCSASGNCANTGDAPPAGYTAENVSWRKPGSVSSSVATAPPGRSAASSTVTAWPARASVIAAASPLGPDPITTAAGALIAARTSLHPRGDLTRRGAAPRYIVARVTDRLPGEGSPGAQSTDAGAAGASFARSILDTAHDAFVSIDAAGRIIDWNQAAERTFGYPRDEVLGRPLTDTIVPERYRQADRDGIQRFLRTGERTIARRRAPS